MINLDIRTTRISARMTVHDGVDVSLVLGSTRAQLDTSSATVSISS